MQRNSRDDRFANLGMRDEPSNFKGQRNVRLHEGEFIAAWYEVPKPGSSTVKLQTAYFGQIVQLKYEKPRIKQTKNKTYRVVSSLDIDDPKGKVMCKWLEPAMSGKGKNKKHRKIGGKLCYRMKLECTEGFNTELNQAIDMYPVITPVVMTYNKQHELWLLDNEDRKYVDDFMTSMKATFKSKKVGGKTAAKGVIDAELASEVRAQQAKQRLERYQARKALLSTE